MTHGFVRLDLTAEEMDKLQAAAKEANQTPRQYMRARLGLDAGPTFTEAELPAKPETKQAKVKFEKVTNNAADLERAASKGKAD